MSNDRRTIYPVKGRTVRVPELSNLPIPPEGVEVDWTPHWQQMLHFGDIRLKTEKVDEAKDEPAEAAEKAPPKK